MNAVENLLVILAEDCVETAQRATKAVRFGVDEVQSEQNLTNAERIIYEFNDIVAVLELLQEQGAIGNYIDRGAIDKKKMKIAKYTSYSVQLGIVESLK